MKIFSALALLIFSISGHASQEFLSPFSKFSFSTEVNGKTLEIYLESSQHKMNEHPERVYYWPSIISIKFDGVETVIPKQDYEKFGGFDIGLINVRKELDNLIYIVFPIGLDPRNELTFVFQDWQYKGSTNVVYQRIYEDNTQGLKWEAD